MEFEAPTRSERKLISQLKLRLLDLEDELQENKELLSNQELIRWIRARDQNVDDAEEMFRNSMLWRTEIGADCLLHWQPHEMFPKKFPFSVSGFDLDGCPVVIFQAGKMDFREAIDEGYLEDGLKYLYRCLEQLVSLSRKISTNQESMKKITAVIDMEGFQFRQIRCRKLLEEFANVLHVYEANYPETLKAAVLVNVPTIFALIYRIVCRILNSKTLSKIQLYNSSVSKYSLELLKLMSSEEFPEKYGGTGLISTNIISTQNISISNNN